MSLHKRLILFLALIVSEIADADLDLSLARAAKRGDSVAATAALKGGANVNFRSSVDRTPLIIAAMHGHASTVEVLLESGADMYARDSNEHDALTIAVEHRHLAVVRTLLARGFDPSRDEWRALKLLPREHGTRKNQIGPKALEIRQMLEERKEKGDRARIHTAMVEGAETSQVRIPGAALDADLERGAHKGDLYATTAALKAGANVNARFQLRRTALIIAARRGHVAVVDALLSAGADMYARDSNDYDALMIAAEYEHPAVVRTLLSRGFDPALNDWRVLQVLPNEKTAARISGVTAKHRETRSILLAHKEKPSSTTPSPAAPVSPASPAAPRGGPTAPAPALGGGDEAPPVTIDIFGQKISPEMFNAAASKALQKRGWKIASTGDNGLVGTLSKDKTYRVVVALFPPVIVISYERGYGSPRQNWLLNIRRDLLLELNALMARE